MCDLSEGIPVSQVIADLSRRLGWEQVPQTTDELFARLPSRDAAADEMGDDGDIVASCVGSQGSGRRPFRRILARDDVRSISSRLRILISENCISPAFLAAWQRHLLAESGESVDNEQSDVLAKRVLDSLNAVREFSQRVDIDVVPSLGRNVAGAALIGPTRTRIVLGEDAVHDAFEAQFYAYHIFAHTLIYAGHAEASTTGFACWIEHRREPLSPDLPFFLEPWNDGAERDASDAAACSMYDRYISNTGLSAFSRSLLRGALRRQVTSTPVIRAILGDRRGLRHAFAERLSEWFALAPGGVKLQFTEHLAVVRQRDTGHIYLVWTDPLGIAKKRWIPSSRVLRALGVLDNDVPSVDGARLGTYGYDGILMDPDDVEVVRSALADSTSFTIGPAPMRRRAQLLGLSRARSTLLLPTRSEEIHVAVTAGASFAGRSSAAVDGKEAL
jgi:hypothetical protein